MIFCAATTAEERAARKLGVHAVRVGVRVANGVPEGRLVSFGLAGALHDGVAIGEVLDATRVVDESGSVLWEGPGLGVGRPAILLGADELVHDAGERARLHAASGADAVDMESGVLARSGRLAGCVRAVSDTPDATLGSLAGVVRTDGSVSYGALARAVGSRPRASVRAIRQSQRALRALAEAAS